MAEQFGYNTGNVLESILASKRADKRQAMLDDLARQNVQSEMKAREEQADTNKMYRGGLIEDRQAKQQRATAFATAFRTFKDSPDYKAMPVEQQRAYDLAATLGADSPIAHELIGRMAMPPKKEQPEGGNIFSMDREGNPFDTGVWMPKGSTLRQEPATPQPNAASLPQLWYNMEQDPNDPKKTVQVPYMMTATDFQSFLNKYKAEHRPPVGPPQPGVTVPPVATPQARRGNLPVTPVQKPVVPYDKTAYNTYQAALRSASPNASPARVSARSAFLNTLTDPEVKKDVLAIIAHPRLKTMTSEQLIQTGVLQNTPTDPNHIPKVKEILDLIPSNNRE